MKKVNIREALLDMDKQTYCQYDLYTLYEACNLQECDKKEIAKMISDDKSPEDIYDKLVDKFSDSVTTTDDDDISDVKESFGDDLIDSQYQDDTSDGHWSWDYDDDELANIYGGDTKYDNHPDGVDMDEYDLDESTKGFIRSYCDECGKMNRVEVEFKDFNKPFEDTIYTCSHCGAKNLLTDPHEYNVDGTIKESQNTDLHKGNSITEDTSDRTSTDFSWSKGWCDCGAKDVFPHMLFATDAGTVFREGPYGYRLRGEVFAENPNIFHAYVMKYTDNSDYASHGQGGKTVVGKENLDSLEAAKAFIEDWFTNSFDSYVKTKNESLTETTENDGWVKRWNFIDNYYKGDLVISKISSPVDAWHIEKVAPNGHTIKHLGNYKSLEVAMDAAEKHLMKNGSKSIKESSLVDKKVSTLGKRGKPMYFTADQLEDAKEKYPEYDFEETTIEYSLPAGQKAYIAKKKTNESKSIKESNKIAYGNEKYKGYMIRQDHKYGGYNVYDREDEMEDSGFKTIDKAKEFIDSLEESIKVGDNVKVSTPLKKVETAVEKLGGRVINTEPENNLVEICAPSETLDDEWISQLKSEIDNIDSIDSVDIDEQTFYKYQRDTYSGKWEHIPYDGYNVFISLTHNRNIPSKELSKETTLDEGIDGWDNRTGVIKRIDKYLYDNPEAIPPKGYIQPGSRAYDDAVSRYGDYVTTPFGNISTDDLMQYARDNKLLDESKYTSSLIGPDSLLMNAEEAYFDDNLGDFVADTLNDGSATEEELLAVTEKSSFIEYDDMLNAIDYAKSLNESFDISWNGNKIATSANKNLCESIVKKALKASSTPDLVIESAGNNVTNKFIRSIVESQDIHEGTSLKRIARYNEFDNGNVLHNYEKMTSEEAEERAKQASIDNPDDIYYVAYDDIMDSSSDLRWINGKSYNYSDVQIKGGKPYIKDASANESIEDTSIEDIDKFVAEVKEKFPGSEAIYDGDTNTIKITLDNVQKENLTEDSTESDELETADQKISSANTSINSSKLPAIFRLVKFEPDTLNLDYGGGKFDNAAEYLAQQNVTNLVYDPYNRSTQHNAEVLQKVRKNGGADTITISNVLNVIAEPEARLTVLRNAKKLVKPGGNVYITVYEGNKSGEGTETKSGYQLNKSTADYIDEIASVFSTVNRKGKLIIAS